MSCINYEDPDGGYEPDYEPSKADRAAEKFDNNEE